MSRIEEIDRSLIVIFDIEGYSTKNPDSQAILVKSFIENLDAKLATLGAFKADAFSTGDGAIVSIGRNCKLDRETTKLFMDFVINFSLDMIKQGLIIRAVVNYAEKDKVLILDESGAIQGKYVQIGDTINYASRIIAYCEPREIMINKTVFDFLRLVTLDNTYSFIENDELVAKHEILLKTYSYNPKLEEREYLYSPDSPSRPFKKYKSFPPIKNEMLEFFRGCGLDLELKNVIENAFDSIGTLNKIKRFVTWNNVLNVLVQLPYDPTDKVYIVSRNDRAVGFWTQPRKNTYITYLRLHADKSEGFINQTRIIVYDDSKENNPLSSNDIIYDLTKLHKPGTFFSLPSGGLMRYETIRGLIFGFTLSTKHRYAIIPIPAPEAVDHQKPIINKIEDMLALYKDYDVADGPMRAIITANEKCVQTLIDEMERLLADPLLTKIEKIDESKRLLIE